MADRLLLHCYVFDFISVPVWVWLEGVHLDSPVHAVQESQDCPCYNCYISAKLRPTRRPAEALVPYLFAACAGNGLGLPVSWDVLSGGP